MKSLRDFPEAFQPMVTVTGDRREVPPQSRGDLLAYSVSSTDYMFISHLGLGRSQVLSDKQFVIDSDDLLRRRFGNTNILVIGSPAVNLLSRRINKAAAFRFDISPDTLAELEEQYRFMDEYVEPLGDDLFIYYQCLEGILDVDSILHRFVDLEPNLDDLRKRAERITYAFRETQIFKYIRTSPRPVRYLLHKLDQPGIFDSVAEVKRGETIGANKDYGLISVLPNPFSTSAEYYVVYVAGVHGPATALGLRLLANKQAFQHHPFGGVFEVNLDRFALFFDKFQQSKERWETRPYEQSAYAEVLDQLLAKPIRVFLSTPAPKNDEAQKGFNATVKKLLHDACRERQLRLEIEGPYTLPMGGGTDFWDNILSYEERCFFVVHDATGSSKGVMVELGFSIGKKKQHFLIWNTDRLPITNWQDMHVPSLLPTTNIEPFDHSDIPGACEVLSKKILAKALEDSRGANCATCEVDTPDSKQDAVFMYFDEPLLGDYLNRQLAERHVDRITDEESSRESRLCRICEVLRKARAAFIQVSDRERSGFIVLGIAKAAGALTLPIALERGLGRGFPWARQVAVCNVDTLQERLDSRIAKFLGRNV